MLVWDGISKVWSSHKGLYAILSSWQDGLEVASSATEMLQWVLVWFFFFSDFINLVDFSGTIILNLFDISSVFFKIFRYASKTFHFHFVFILNVACHFPHLGLINLHV